MPIAFIPGENYPSISITGNRCFLNCKYCGGKYLNQMYHVATPQDLYNLIEKLWDKGMKGFLISGGFDKNGQLPLKPFLSTIKKIKKDFDPVISVHPGLVDINMVVEMRRSGIDIVDYGFIIDDFIIQEVMNLKNRSHRDFKSTLKHLYNNGPPYIAPHILIGLNYGSIKLEYQALEHVIEYDPYIIIFLVFIPTKGTQMEHVKPPEIEKIVELIKYARTIYNGEIALGCMRPPHYKPLLDEKLLKKNLIDRIVLPISKIIRNFNLRIINACCSIPREFFNRFS